jgi:hypothetical protein
MKPFLLYATLCLATTAQAADVATLLQDADRYRSGQDALRVDTQVAVFNRDGTPDKQRRYTVFVQPGPKSLVLMRSPADQGQKVLMLGDDFWLLMPGSQRALRITPSQKLLGDIATLSWSQDYSGTLVGEEPCEPAAPAACLHLSLQARRRGVSYQRIELWLGRLRHEPVKAELHVQSDKLAKRARFVMAPGAAAPGGAKRMAEPHVPGPQPRDRMSPPKCLRRRAGRPGLAQLAAAAIAVLSPVHARADDTGMDLLLVWEARGPNASGLVAQANGLSAGIVPQEHSGTAAELSGRGSWRLPRGLAVHAEARGRSARMEGRATAHDARFNELQASADLGAWQASAGKKVIGWDVSQGFRPNDMVEQETRRTLLETRPEGRPLLQVEHFGAASAAALVWVNPLHLNDLADAQRFGAESALAARGYLRASAADWHVFARQGRHTGSGLGLALAWVASDALELHASARAHQRHDGWHLDDAAGTAPVATSPWQVRMLGAATQALLGATWTGEHRQSVMAEWWHDGTALPDGEWGRWQARNTALLAGATRPGPAAASAGNLAWQAMPLAAPSLRRDNLFVRLAWQAERWQVGADLLFMPADAGRVATAGVQWQGERLRLTTALRRFGGPGGALAAQIPQRHAGVVAASWAW